MAVLLARGQITIAAIKDGAPGPQGKPGKDAVSIIVEDAPLVFDTDDNGIVPVSISKAAKVKIMKGNLNISNECSNINSRDDLCVNCKCVAIQKDGYIEVSVSGSNIAKNDVVIDGINQGQISATSGYAVAQFVYTGVLYFAQVPFSVNVSKYMGSVKVTAKQYQSQFKALENDLKGSNPTVLKAYTSTIKQAAREISLSVSEKSIGRRNLLVGSAFNRQEGFGLNRAANIRGYGILMNDGVDGMNCIKVASYYDTNRHQYCGAFWGGIYTKNIRIKHGTQYTFSCWVKVDEADTIVYLEVIYNRAEIGQDRDGRPTGAYAFAIKEPNKWQLVKWSFTTDTHNWIEANVYTCSGVAYKTFVARFCKPMLEEGDYNGWTLSQEDYDYVGGNLLDDTMALTRSSDNSNLQFASGLIMFSKYEGCYGILYNKNNSAESQLTEALQYKFPTTATLSGQARIVKNQDYVFSFVAKGCGNINVFLYGDSVHANVFTETCEGNVYPVGLADGYTQLALTSTYKRYWVHWRINDYTGEGAEVIPDKVLICVPGDTEAWVAKPKLEEGAQMTEYTEKKTDLIDKSTAKAAGLEITADGVELYGDKVKVKNNGKTAAMFTDGKLNADLIDADTINVHHVWAKDGNNQNTLAHFGNYGIIEAKDEEGRSCPLWVGSSTASSSPFRVSKDGYMYAEKGAFGIRYYEDEESGEQRAYGRFEITANGIETGEVFKEDSMSLTDTRFHLIKQKGNNEKLSNDAIFLDSHGDTLPVPGLGVYLKAKVRVDASGVLNSESNVCYYANAKNGLQNYAIYGSGDISLDGSVYAYKATMVNLKTKNVFLDNTGSIGVTTYNEPQTIDSLTLLVNSQNGLALTLPTLGTIEQMLFGVYSARSKFCVRLTIIMDVGSTRINLRGRCLAKDQAGVAQWNHADFPLMFNWNGNYASDFDMAEGDSCEFLLTYDPNKNYKAGIFEQPYIARIINLQH